MTEQPQSCGACRWFISATPDLGFCEWTKTAPLPIWMDDRFDEAVAPVDGADCDVFARKETNHGTR